ncbi:MAG: FPP/GGPP synthase family protein [Sphaerochaetaceae bacterium]|jgi:geranylgeranyl pyrophosphate synthase
MQKLFDDIELELKRALPDNVDLKWIENVNTKSFEYDLSNQFDKIIEPAADLVYRGGKRWRPLLMVLTASMIGNKDSYEKAVKLSPLVELPHNGSLIIDDIEDQAVLRRGKEAIHLLHGVDLAINGGNLLYYLPTYLIDQIDLPVEKKLNLYKIYSTYMRKIHLGQGLDILWHKDLKFIPTVESYQIMCRLKTGCLAAMGASLGATIGTDNQNLILQSGELAEKVGLAFQIIDDLINLESGNVGKNRGDDIVENKKSLPIILYATRFADQRKALFELFEEARKDGYEKSKDKIYSFIEQIEQSGILKEVKTYANTLLTEIVKEIKSLYKESKERSIYIEMVSNFIE